MRFLLWLGLTRKKSDGSYRFPVHVSPWHIWRYLWAYGQYCGFFRNLPGVVKWEEGRLLPRRWGFYILGFEIGDRG